MCFIKPNYISDKYDTYFIIFIYGNPNKSHYNGNLKIQD